MMGVVLMVVLLGFLMATLAVHRFGARDRARPSPVIIVLGARVLESGVGSGSLQARTRQAIELYRRGLSPLILFSGGERDQRPAEALVARDQAIRAGVPESACLVETDSQSTAENARYSARVLQARGVREAILVSDPYHLLRAQQYFHRAGISVLPSPAPLTGRELSFRQRGYWTLREVMALLLHPKLWLVRRPR